MELTIEQVLQQGIEAHREGKLAEAKRLYQAILQAQPLHPDANHNLGVLSVSVNNVQEALLLFKTAIEANPKMEQFWLSFIDVLIKDKQFDNAKKAIEQGKKQGVSVKKLDTYGSKVEALGQGRDFKSIKRETTFSEKRKKLAADKKTKKLQKQKGKGSAPSKTDLVKLIEYYQTGQYGDAEKLAVFITQKFPKHQFSWKFLGMLFGLTGRHSLAVNANQKAVLLSPQDAEAHNNLGASLRELGRLDESETSCKQAIALKSDYAEAHSNLGNTLYELGRLDEATGSYSLAIALQPEFSEAYSNMGATLQELGRLDEAEASYKQAIVLRPDYAHAHSNLGNTLKEAGRLDEAKVSYTQAIAFKPDYAEAHYNLGNTLREMGRLDEATLSYTLAIAFKPDFSEACSNLGTALQGLGRLDEAEANFMQAIELRPDYGEAHRHLALIKKFDSQDEQYSKMLELYLNESISEEQRCHINFGLAKACEDLKDFEQAFVHYSEGNMLRKKRLSYKVNKDIELFEQLKSSYVNIKQNQVKPDKESNNPVPIFIVGMPRSGTTLVEQIISSHSKVTGAGELSFATQFGASIAQGLSDSNKNSLLNFRKEYLTKLQDVANDNLIVTDKMPQNFLYIGLLAAAFPEAKIVHVKRNPAAVCWANYKTYFVSNNIGYCYALEDLVSYHGLYENLMEFWEKSLGQKIYHLDYERLTVNQESETRQLIDYLGLDWDEKCLTPQNNTRSVATASNLQVRKKLYQGSSEQWKKYKPFLHGALDELPAT